MMVSSLAAAATMPLMKRVLVFIALILSSFCVAGCCPCLRLNMTVQSGGFLAIALIFTKVDLLAAPICGQPAPFAKAGVFKKILTIRDQSFSK
jgi:hypothetical protein